MSTSLVEIARGLAENAHAGQRDKLQVPYIEHPAAVAAYVEQLPGFIAADKETREAAVCAAWLHDVSEDTPATAESLADAGLPATVVSAVVALTRTDEVADDDTTATSRSSRSHCWSRPPTSPTTGSRTALRS